MKNKCIFLWRIFQILQKNLSELFTKKSSLISRSLLANFKNFQNEGFWPHIYFVKWTRKSTFLLIFGAYLTRKIARKSQIFEPKWISNDIFHLIWKCITLNMEFFVENGFCAHFLAQMTYCTKKILQIYCTFLSMYDVFPAYFIKTLLNVIADTTNRAKKKTRFKLRKISNTPQIQKIPELNVIWKILLQEKSISEVFSAWSFLITKSCRL